MTDYIEREQSKQQLFFTFNHPSKHLLAQLAIQICNHLNLQHRTASPIASIGESLDRIQTPLHPFTKRQLGLQFESSAYFSGIDETKTQTDRFRQFTLNEIVERFYQVYEQRKDEILTLSNLTQRVKVSRCNP